MRAEILAATNHVDQAIAQLEKLAADCARTTCIAEPAGHVLPGRQPAAKAIEAASQILTKEPDNYAALRFRADAYLNIGKHAEAIADFDKAYHAERR